MSTAITRSPGRRAVRPRVPRGIRLFGRARSLPAYAAGTVIVALLAWWAGEWLVSRPMSAGAIDRGPVVAFAPLAIAILVATTLFAADEELESTAARRMRRLRLVLVILLTVVGAAAVAVTGLEERTVYGAVELTRNTLGCVGMVVVAAPLLGGRLAWAPVFGYVATGYFAAPGPLEPETGWWAWPSQSSGSTSAWWACGTWFVAGVAVYAWKGSRHRRSVDS